MKKSLFFVCLMLAGLATAAEAQMNKSEYGRKAAEKLVKGDRAGAIAVLDKAIEQRKDLNELYALRAHLRQSVGNLDGALADLNEAIKLTPNNPRLYEYRASLRAFKRDHAGALQDYDAAIANGFKVEKIYVGRAGIKRDMGDTAGAIADYQSALAINPMLAAAHNMLAFTYEIKGDLNAAIVHLQDFLDRYEGQRGGKLPSVQGATPVRSSISIEREGKEPDGSQVIMEGQESFVSFKSASAEEMDKQQAKMEQTMNLAVAYANLGRMYAKRNEFDKALENYEKGLSIRKDDAYIHKLRSETRIKQGDLRGAIEDLKVSTGSQMAAPDRHFDKGLLLVLQGKDEEAEKEFALHFQRFPQAGEFFKQRIEAAKKLRAQQQTQP